MNKRIPQAWSQNQLAYLIAGTIFLFQLGYTKNAQADSGDSVLVTDQYRKLIAAENDRDTLTIKSLLFRSPGTLLVAKTQTKEEGGWAGFWGDKTVMQHLTAMVSGGTFKISPNFEKLRTFFIKPDVAEVYAPVQISVSYAGQNPVPRPFLMVTIWIKENKEWKMQSDIAIPVPQG